MRLLLDIGALIYWIGLAFVRLEDTVLRPQTKECHVVEADYGSGFL